MAKGVIFLNEAGEYVQMERSGSFSTKATVVGYTLCINHATVFVGESVARREHKELEGHIALQAESFVTVRLLPPSQGSAETVVKNYVVQLNDTLSGISLKLCGNADRYRELATLNKIADTNTIFPGAVLRIPENWTEKQ